MWMKLSHHIRSQKNFRTEAAVYELFENKKQTKYSGLTVVCVSNSQLHWMEALCKMSIKPDAHNTIQHRSLIFCPPWNATGTCWLSLHYHAVCLIFWEWERTRAGIQPTGDLSRSFSKSEQKCSSLFRMFVSYKHIWSFSLNWKVEVLRKATPLNILEIRFFFFDRVTRSSCLSWQLSATPTYWATVPACRTPEQRQSSKHTDLSWLTERTAYRQFLRRETDSDGKTVYCLTGQCCHRFFQTASQAESCTPSPSWLDSFTYIESVMLAVSIYLPDISYTRKLYEEVGERWS